MVPLQNVAIYDGLDTTRLAPDRQTWSSGVVPEFEELIRSVKPKAAIEVGSWKGVSACRIAAAAGPDCTLYCVDTWLGSLEHHVRRDADYGFPSSHGFPLLYFQFLVNVKAAGFEKQIVPIPNTSTIGAKILSHHLVRADFIYIDASHEYLDCFMDLALYWELLNPGGVMLVDDVKVFAGVAEAVKDFTEREGLTWELLGDTFAVIRKAA